MTVAQALAEAARRSVGRLDAQLLLLHALGRPRADRAWLLAHDGDALSAPAETVFSGLCAQRLDGVPVAYLLGHKEFFGLDLLVDARVLVPRPETELLVEWALALLQDSVEPTVADLGTGSGAIALAIKSSRPDARLTAIDASDMALEVARANATRLGLAIECVRDDWLSGLDRRFDMLVGNPPYVARQDAHLADLRHEPVMALASGADGLDAIRRIVSQASSHLAPGGWLLLEHGWDQSQAVRDLLVREGFKEVQSRPDLAGIERCSGGRWLERG